MKPYAKFVPLFRQTKMMEQDFMFVLEEEKTAQDTSITERLDVSGGRDRASTPLTGYKQNGGI